MKNEYIILEGCKENNLKNVSLQIPKHKITVFTGVSGSGKSSIVFDTIAQEAGRQLNETFSFMVRLFMPRYTQPNADSIQNLSAAIIIDQNRIGGNIRSTLGTITDINTISRVFFSRFATPHIGYGNSYSFNDPAGMCPTCEGIGKVMGLDESKALDIEKSLNEGAILLPGFQVGNATWKFYAESGYFDCDKKIKDYTKEEYHNLMHVSEHKITMSYRNQEYQMTYEGLARRFIRANVNTERERSKQSISKFDQFSKVGVCPKCEGKRLNDHVLSSKIMGYSIYDMTEMQIDELIEVLNQFDDKAAQPLIKGLVGRLQILIDIGLSYMNLNRETSTLSGGESQRVKMVKHLSSSLSEMIYIFDEPSIGLHPRDIVRLNNLLLQLRDKGNTIIIVEHDIDVIKIADHVIDMGPKAGSHGGEVTYEGNYEGLLHSDTLSGKFLKVDYPLKEQIRKSDKFLESSSSDLHNLKNVSLRIPKGVFSVVSGVAGSGKSTLVNEVFAREFEDIIKIDQNEISVNVRSNPATFTKIMDAIRKCFSQTNNVDISLFSYNSKGACPKCKGLGKTEINLSFMDKAEIVCDECDGKRFRKEVLEYFYHYKDINEVMELSIEDAYEFFEVKEIKTKLKQIMDVGLGYMSLGQPLSTLSGGERQRIKLARELSKKGNIYILDEPTTGLHRSDIQNILKIINTLVDHGNTVIAIEHNLDIMKQADWMIDMGPNGGVHGGEILFEGTPKDLLNCEKSITAQYLKEILK